MLPQKLVHTLCFALVYLVAWFYTAKGTKSTQVLDYPIEGSGENIAIGNDEEWKTREIASCFKMKLRYSHGYTILASEHLELDFYGNDSGFGFVNYMSDAGHTWDSISRLFTFCNNSFGLGKWISMCFDMKLESSSQTVRVFIGGVECLSKTFEDGNFDWLHMRRLLIGKAI